MKLRNQKLLYLQTFTIFAERNKFAKITMSAKEISVAEKEPNEALQVKRSTSEFGDFSARANFFWC
jgi:hypothetical protein